MGNNIDWNSIEKLLDELFTHQYKKLYSCGTEIIPNLTTDDLLQPNDFQELEFHPHFRYEEGVLAGIQTVQTALNAIKRDNLQ